MAFEKIRFECHAHTTYSNIRLLDCINQPKDLINRAIEVGLKGIAITDHECLSAHIQVEKIKQEIKEEYPDFKIGLGNEIYLTYDRRKSQQYYHFILIAKDAVGHRQLRQLSTIAWLNSYKIGKMERVPTTYEELENVVKSAPGHLIATTACLGGQASSTLKKIIEAEQVGDTKEANKLHNELVDFMEWCVELFGEDFYVECAPGCSKEQIAVNKRLRKLAKAFGIKMVIGSDAHYLRKEDRFVHKAYLQSQEGEREVDAFYEFSYLQTNEEEIAYLAESDFEPEFVEEMWHNSSEIADKIGEYDLFHNQSIPSVKVDCYPPIKAEDSKHPILASMFNSDDDYDRYWVNQCMQKLKDKGLNKPEYVDRLEEEADIKKIISEKLGTNMFKYPITLQHYINMFWECGSTVGAGRGSSCSGLNHYLLGVTQIDPVRWGLPFWRYLNKDRVEIGDIDLDLCPSKRPLILEKIKAERGQNFYEDIDDLSRNNLGCTLVATFGTETSKSAIMTACRGYRSEEYPDGIPYDTAAYLSSLIPVDRGAVWSVKDLIEGNAEKGRKPVKSFISEINKYPRLLEIVRGIEGLINKRSSHASGVILFDKDPYYNGCFMKTPSGDVITQYDLHDAEAVGMVKYDFLLTEVQDKITKTIEILQEYGEIDPNLTIREVYDKYLQPDVIELDCPEVWENIKQGNIINVFQFDSEIGSQAAKKIQPKTILELMDANGLMRLMTSGKGELSPLDKYVLYKSDISLWYEEMRQYGLSEEEMKILEPYFLSSYGVPPSQEQMMKMLMDPKICNFSLADANAARKIVGKKLMDKVPVLREQVLESAENYTLGMYVWEYGIGPQMGYSFSQIHALAYSFIGYQTAYLATKWNSIYWDTACLIVNSGALETASEDDDEEAKEKQTDYAKIAKALGDIRSNNIKVSMVDINHSTFDFKPDIKNNQILYGLKALRGVNKEAIAEIEKHRPYVSIKDFLNKCKLKKTAVISLIKGGAFDELDKEWAAAEGLHPRYAAMAFYLRQTSDLKTTLNLRNLQGLIKVNLIPEEYKREKQIYLFTQFIKNYRKKNYKGTIYYVLNDSSDIEIYQSLDLPVDYLDFDNDRYVIEENAWNKLILDNVKDVFRTYIADNLFELLTKYNQILFKQEWKKYSKGTLSDWEMDALCFYYTKHELEDINLNQYGIVDFYSLPEDPEPVSYYRNYPIYDIVRIAGTVISKTDNRTSISLLTKEGVVNVKFTRDYYALYKKRISAPGEDGKNKIMEEGWFSKGTKLIISGYRREDQFVSKKYKATGGHQMYKITNVDHNYKTLEVTNLRYGQSEDQDIGYSRRGR